MKKILVGIIVIVIISIIIVLFLLPTLGKTNTSSILSPTSRESISTKRIVGFLPYWQTESVENLNYSLLDEVIYFGLHTNEEGEIATRDSNGNKDVGYARFTQTINVLKNAVKGQHTGLSVAIILQDNEKIEAFLKSEAAQKRLIQNVSSLITQNPELSGINLDFEYSGIPGREIVTAYTNFVTNFVNELKTKNPELIVSVAATADAVKKSRLYDVEKLAKAADFVFLMGYDFYRSTSSVAGPVSPLTGKEIYDYDVTSAVLDFLTLVPKHKLVLGVPYYGWDYPTIDEEKGSLVDKRPDSGVALATYKRTKKLIAAGNVTLRFDEESQTPWLTYKDPDTGDTRQIWFEDEVSLGKKYDLVNRENLAGIAIWALGYDGNHSELWELLKEKFVR